MAGPNLNWDALGEALQRIMNIRHINPLLEATVNVLSTMASVHPKPGKPRIKQGQAALGDVTGIIRLDGSDVRGSLAISFPKRAILYISSKMLGEQFTELDDAVVDVVGEITNMITGNAKRIYSEQGIEFNLTRPCTQVGANTDVVHNIAGTTVILPFSSEGGDFFIEFCFAE